MKKIPNKEYPSDPIVSFTDAIKPDPPSYCGYDMPAFLGSVNYFAPYARHVKDGADAWTLACLRSFKKPGGLYGLLYGGFGPPRRESCRYDSFQRWQPWRL